MEWKFKKTFDNGKKSLSTMQKNIQKEMKNIHEKKCEMSVTGIIKSVCKIYFYQHFGVPEIKIQK